MSAMMGIIDRPEAEPASKPLVMRTVDENGASVRSPYSPTPLAANNLLVDVGGTYFDRSPKMYGQILGEAYKQKKYPREIIALAGISIRSLHAMRCVQNTEATELHEAYLAAQGITVTDDESELIRRAKVGEAKTPDLLELLAKNLGFRAIEFAKYTHVFQEDGPEPMIQKVATAIEDRDPEALLSPQEATDRIAYCGAAYSKDGSEVLGVLAATKYELAYLHHDKVRVVVRSGRILNFKDEALMSNRRANKQMHKIVRYLFDPSGNEDRVSQMLAESDALVGDAIDREADWVIDTATSVYGVRVDHTQYRSKSYDGSKQFYPLH